MVVFGVLFSVSLIVFCFFGGCWGLVRLAGGWVVTILNVQGITDLWTDAFNQSIIEQHHKCLDVSCGWTSWKQNKWSRQF